MKPILLVDNYDSFTFNLLHCLEAEGDRRVEVFKNDNLKGIETAKYAGILISPGPGLPSESNQLLEFLNKIKSDIPILGVCLGMQAIAETFGMQLKNLDEVVHGQSKELTILNSNSILFNGIKSPTLVGRYHSWVIDREKFNDEFSIIAVDDQNQIMAIEHKKMPICAVQYHPESILTIQGKKMISNWLKSLKDYVIDQI